MEMIVLMISIGSLIDLIFLIFPKLGVRLGLYSEREIENVRLVHLIFFIILSVLAVVFVSIKLKL